MPVGGIGLIFIPASADRLRCNWWAVVAGFRPLPDHLQCGWHAGVACYSGGRVPTT